MGRYADGAEAVLNMFGNVVPGVKQFNRALGVGHHNSRKRGGPALPPKVRKKLAVQMLPRRVRKNVTKKAIRKAIRSDRKSKGLGKMKSDIRTLKRDVEGDMGTLVYRKRGVSQSSAAINQNLFISTTGITRTTIEEAIKELRYFDIATPGTLVKADGTAGTYQKEFNIKSSKSSWRVRNNYMVAVKCTLYVFTPRVDTNITPFGAVGAGLLDQGNPDKLSVLIHPTDSIQLKDLWHIANSQTKILQPGQSMVIYHRTGPFQYDPSLMDSHPDLYQKRFHAMTFGLRLEGVIGHDSMTTTVQTSMKAGVDHEERYEITIRYPAGVDLHYIHLNDTGDTAFANGGRATNKPVADGQNYDIT